MLIFETVLALLLGATVLSIVARKASIPYPTLLALVVRWLHSFRPDRAWT
jgi:hypothetical protein